METRVRYNGGTASPLVPWERIRYIAFNQRTCAFSLFFAQHCPIPFNATPPSSHKKHLRMQQQLGGVLVTSLAPQPSPPPPSAADRDTLAPATQSNLNVSHHLTLKFTPSPPSPSNKRLTILNNLHAGSLGCAPTPSQYFARDVSSLMSLIGFPSPDGGGLGMGSYVPV